MPGSSIISFSATPVLGGPSRESNKWALSAWNALFSGWGSCLMNFGSNFVPLRCRFEAALGSSYSPFLTYYTSAHSEINFVTALSFNLYIWGNWFLVQTQTLGIETAPAVLNRKSQFLKTKYFSRKADTSHISATVHIGATTCVSPCTAGFGLTAQEADTRTVGHKAGCVHPQEKVPKISSVFNALLLGFFLSVLMGWEKPPLGLPGMSQRQQQCLPPGKCYSTARMSWTSFVAVSAHMSL